jgi:rhodanese-related sulfurtransferase
MQTMVGKMHDPAKAKAFFEAKLAFTTGPVELNRMIQAHENNFNLIDVRAPEDYAKEHIPGAINLPKEKWAHPEGLSEEKTNIVYCYSMVCHLAASACMVFASQGFPVMELDGGFDEWKEHELDIEAQTVNRLK